MKKNYLHLLILFISMYSFSQQRVESLCQKNFNIHLEEQNLDGLSYADYFTIFKWDSSIVNNNQSNIQKLQLEIVPIVDCFNGVNGSDLKKGIIIDLKKKSSEGEKTLRIFHKEIMAKCFKWRVKLVSEGCSEMSTWKYYLFIK